MRVLTLLSLAALSACSVQDVELAARIATSVGEFSKQLECDLQPGCHEPAE